MYGKHYEGEHWFHRHLTERIVSVRLSSEEIRILQDKYPGKTLSYAIRSLIHQVKM